MFVHAIFANILFFPYQAAQLIFYFCYENLYSWGIVVFDTFWLYVWGFILFNLLGNYGYEIDYKRFVYQLYLVLRNYHQSFFFAFGHQF